MESAPAITDAELQAAENEITETRLLTHSAILASDEFGGRFPGTDDEAKTLEYLERCARKVGCTPGNRSDDSFLQHVPLVKVTPIELSAINVDGGALTLQTRQDCMIWSSMIQDEVHVNDSDIYFLGYGITAPHQAWDDFGNLDLRGKTIVVLVNDPGYASNDENLFNGRAMTYYGRWTYKARGHEFETAPSILPAKLFPVHALSLPRFPSPTFLCRLTHFCFELILVLLFFPDAAVRGSW